MNTVRIGTVDVTRVVEWVGPISTVDQLFPDTPADAWTADLAPDYWAPAGRAYRAAIQTWVLRSAGLTILVDTGVGNGRDRPQVPAFADLQTDYLDRLADAEVDPDEVDIVVNTHIHYDHVGWNTRWDGSSWVPTFPNASYLVPQADVDYFRPENAERMRAPRTPDERARFDGIRLVFADSIAPILDAGLLRPWSGEHRIDDVLHLDPAPGHTPGSSVLWLHSGAGAVFVGDLIHTPVQLARPGDSCAFDLDAEQARASRRAVLAATADAGATIFPAHFAGPGGTAIRSSDDGYEPDAWTALSSV